MPVVFLLKGVSSFPNPGNWNPYAGNKIECVGAGCAGGVSVMLPLGKEAVEPQAQRNPGGGGGGGGYAYQDNIPYPVFPVAVNVAVGGSVGTGSPDSASTWWLAADARVNSVQGGNGRSPNLAAGGAGGVWWGAAGFSGGPGGGANPVVGRSGSGGGGAAGPHGTGGGGLLAGTVPEGSTSPSGSGGAGDLGFTPGGTYPANLNGGNGTQWDPSHGCGGGGAGGAYDPPNSVSVAGGKGGQYGGGGGSQAGDSAAPAPGNGGDGLMVITYSAFVPDATSRAIIVM